MCFVMDSRLHGRDDAVGCMIMGPTERRLQSLQLLKGWTMDQPVDGIEATGKKGKSVNNHITYSSSTTRSVVTSQIRAGDN
jgi:hypothetical protein